VYGGCFGTFLYNNEKQRQEHQVKKLTPSLWNYMNKRSVRKSLQSLFYDGSKHIDMIRALRVEDALLWPYYFATQGALIRRNEDAEKERLYTLLHQEVGAANYLKKRFEEILSAHGNSLYNVGMDGKRRLVVEMRKKSPLLDLEIFEDYQPSDEAPSPLDEDLISSFVFPEDDSNDDGSSFSQSWSEYCSSLLVQLMSYPLLPLSFSEVSDGAMDPPAEESVKLE
jgi:hypothetical protein